MQTADMRITTLRFFSLSLFLSFALSTHSQPAAKPASVFETLTQEEAAKIQLELDLEALLQNRKKASYLPATLTDAAGQTFRLEVRTRGKFRRRKCEIPPIKLKFVQADLLTQHLDTLNEIKLVLPCTADASNEQLIVREYIAYRMFESLSPNSARARLIRLELKPGAKKRSQKMFALLVEHEEEIAVRLQSTPVIDWGVEQGRLQMDQAALLVLFEYLIGNTDWELDMCRNVLLLQPAGGEKLLSVPFDFDFSGLVNAPYAMPNSTTGLKRTRDRFLMDKGIDKAALQRAKETILSARPTLQNWCKSRYLSAASSTEMLDFLDAFFAGVANKEVIPPVLEMTKK